VTFNITAESPVPVLVPSLLLVLVLLVVSVSSTIFQNIGVEVADASDYVDV
jgi:hypothetical protein